MGFFSFIQEIAMDLGTANTIIISDDKIVVDELCCSPRPPYRQDDCCR